MKTINNLYSNTLLGLLAILLMVSCQKESATNPTPQQRGVTIEISVSTDEIVRTAPTAMEQIVASLRI